MKNYYAEEVAKKKNYYAEEVATYPQKLKEAYKTEYKERVAPFVHGASTALFGLPKELVRDREREINKFLGKKEYEPIAEKTIFPEQETLEGKILRGGSEVTGILKGAPGKLATKAGQKVIPKARFGTMRGLVEKGGRKGAEKALLHQQMLRGGIEGATIGATLTPEKGLIEPAERGKQAALFGALGYGIPAVASGVSKAGKAIGRSAADYIKMKVVPKAQNIFQGRLMQFGDDVQKFVKDKLKVPQSAIDTIKKKGIDSVNKIRQTYDDSTDALYRKITQGFESQRSMADDYYKSAMREIPDDAVISINKTYNQLERELKRFKFIDESGNVMSRAETIKDPVWNKLISLHQDMKTSLVSSGKARATGGILKNDFELYRDYLGKLYRESPTDVIVMKLKYSLLDDMGTAGYKGLKQATLLQRKAFEAERKLLKQSLIKEGKLDKFHKSSVSKEELRQLKEIEDYTGVKFIDDLDSITASRELEKGLSRGEISLDKFASDLQSATDPKNTKFLKMKYKPILGDKVDDIWNEITGHRGAVRTKKGLIYGAGAIGALGAAKVAPNIGRRFGVIE